MGFNGGSVVSISPADKFESFGSSNNIAAAEGSQVTFTNSGSYNTITFYLTVPPGGTTVEFQGSFNGGLTYERCTLRGVSSDSYTQRTGNTGPFIGSIAGMSHFRVVTLNAGSGPGTIIGQATKEVSTLEGQEQPPPSDFIFNISRGLIRTTTTNHKFGRNADIDTAAEETVWAGGAASTGLYTFSSGTNETWHASSTSTSDTAVQLYTECLDSSYRPINQTVTLNGQTAVALSGALYRVNRGYITGSTAPVGNVYVYKSGGGLTAGVPNSLVDVRTFIDSADCQSLNTVFTVPSGTVAYMMDYHAESSTGNADLKLKVREVNGVFRTRNRINVNAGNIASINFNTYLAIPAKSDIKFDASVSANNTVVSAQYDLILVATE